MGNGLINLSDPDMNDIIKSIIVNNSVAVSLVGTGRDNDVLTNSITQALTAFYNIKKSEIDARRNKAANRVTTAINNQTKVDEEQVIEAKKANEALDIIKDLEKEKKDWNKAQTQRFVKILGEIAMNTGKKMYDETKLRFKWLRELESAGIRLSGGFDESFTKLANSAKLSHDSFIRMIQDNKKSFSSINALGKDAMERLMKASGDIAGKYGLSAEEAFKLTMFYSDQLNSRMSKEEIQNMKLDNGIDVLAKDMKALSIATGKTVEQLIEERKEREKNILMAKINRDPKMAAILDVGKKMGLDEDVLLSAITGVPNEKASMMYTRRGSAAIMDGLIRMVHDETIKNSKDVVAAYSELQKNPAIVEGVKDSFSMNNGILHVLAGSEANLPMMAEYSVKGYNLNEYDGGKQSVDEKALNAYTNTQSELNKISNTMNKKMAVSLETATKGLNLFNKALSKTNTIFEKMPDWAVKVGYATFYSSPTLRKSVSNWVMDLPNSIFGNNYKEDKKPSLFKRLFGSKNNDGDSSNGLKLGPMVKLLSTIAAGALLLLKSGDIANLFVDKNKNPDLHILANSGIKAVGGGLVGYSLLGKPGALGGSAIGFGSGFIQGGLDMLNSDKPNEKYPAHNKETQYGNSGSTKNNTENKKTSNDYMNEYLSRNDEVVTILKNISTYTSALPKMYKEQQFSSNGSIIP